MPRKILVGGRAAWCKTYDRRDRLRCVSLSAWNRMVRRLGVRALRAPPRPQGEQARQLEQRRLLELTRQGVQVPPIVGEGPRLLLLGDLGPSLSSRLKQATRAAEVDGLVCQSVTALVDVHRRGAYLGQAVARNIAVCHDQVGFLDFEEDPRQVMSLADAQARDWLLFSSSVARYYEGRVDTLAQVLGRALPAVGNEVAATVEEAADRLGFLDRWTRRLGHRARSLGVAVGSLRRSRMLWMLALVFLVDFISDGDSDILRALQQLL